MNRTIEFMGRVYEPAGYKAGDIIQEGAVYHKGVHMHISGDVGEPCSIYVCDRYYREVKPATRTLDGVEYEVLERSDCIRPGDGFAHEDDNHFTAYIFSTIGDVTGPLEGYDELRPMPAPQRMIQITYEVTEEYAESQARATSGRNANVNARFEACRRVVDANPVLKQIKTLRKEIRQFADQSIEAEKTVRSCDEMVGKLKADIRNLQDG